MTRYARRIDSTLGLLIRRLRDLIAACADRFDAYLTQSGSYDDLGDGWPR